MKVNEVRMLLSIKSRAQFDKFCETKDFQQDFSICSMDGMTIQEWIRGEILQEVAPQPVLLANTVEINTLKEKYAALLVEYSELVLCEREQSMWINLMESREQ